MKVNDSLQRICLHLFDDGLGFATLYAGLFPTLIRTFFATGALFITYEYVQSLLGRVF